MIVGFNFVWQIFRVPKVIHITCNMGRRDLPDMYAFSPWVCGPRASDIQIRQIPPAHVTTYTYSSVGQGIVMTIKSHGFAKVKFVGNLI